MVTILDYARPSVGPLRFWTFPCITAASALGCFLLPFLMFWVWSGEPAMWALLFPAIAIWCISGILGALGLVANVIALKKHGFNLWLIVSVLASAVPAVMVGYFAVRALLR